MQTLVAAATGMHDRHPFPSVCKITTEVRNLSSTILALEVTSKPSNGGHLESAAGPHPDEDRFCLPDVPIRVGLSEHSAL
jgi:hypothetical protein